MTTPPVSKPAVSTPAPAVPFERCYCTGATQAQILAAIADGARTVEDLQRRTRACSGCGTCRWELESTLEICAAHAARLQEKTPDSPSEAQAHNLGRPDKTAP